MNSNDCILTITTNYNKSFDIKSKNMISIKDIKEQSIKEFNLSNIDKNLLELYLPDGNGKKIYILDEDDIIRNADDTDEDNPTLELNLFIKEESSKELNNINNKNNKNNYKIIIIEKNDKKYSQMEEENKELKKEIEENKKEIKQLKESIEEIKNLLIEKKIIKEKIINNIYESVVINNKNNENKNINDKIQTDDNQNINKKQEKSSQEQTSINLDNSTSENNNNNNEIKKDAPLDDENNKKGEKDNNKEKIHISQSCAEMINSDSPNDTNNEKKNEENNPTPQGPDSKTGETEQQENKQKLNMDLINKIRNEYGKGLDEFSDEKIQKKLEENDNDFQRTVMELMLGTTQYELQKK